MKKILIRISFGLVLFSFTFNLAAQSSKWTEVAPGVWKTIIGNPDKLNLFNAAGIVPAVEALTKMGVSAFPLPENKIVTNVTNRQTYLRFPLIKEEQTMGEHTPRFLFMYLTEDMVSS